MESNDICAVCNNSTTNVTVAGRPESIMHFVEQLKGEKIFARVVNSSGYAFHCKYVADARQSLRAKLEQIITTPMNRSPRWISTSVAESNWSTALAAKCSVDYFINNSKSSVLFHEATQKIPPNAICIEIAPTGLLQAILKRSLGENAINLSLLKCDHPNNLTFLLSAIGK